MGCSIILRGAKRDILFEIKKILKFSIVVAYHLRLEVAYYNDRYAIILTPSVEEGEGQQSYEMTDENSDDDEWYSDAYLADVERGSLGTTDTKMRLLGGEEGLEEGGKVGKGGREGKGRREDLVLYRKLQRDRMLLSTSLDVDICLPYATPIIGVELAHPTGYPSPTAIAMEFQGISCASIIVGDNSQKSKTEIRSMSFYGDADTTVGKFLVDRCFRLKNKDKENLVGNTLTFSHRTGRLEIEITLKEV